MKISIIGVAAFILSINIAHGVEYQSDFGIKLDVPKHWLVITRQELKNNPDLFNLESADFGNVDKNLLKTVIDKIQSGNTELYFNQQTSNASFRII